MQVKKILCPIDFSPSSDRALNLAVELARSFGASLEIVHVFQVPLYVGWEDGPVAIGETARYIEEARGKVSQELVALEQRVRDTGVTVSSRQVDGLPHQRIAELSAAVDLIVLATHGRTGLPHLFMGSVAERVVRLSRCPVVTVPPERAHAS